VDLDKNVPKWRSESDDEARHEPQSKQVLDFFKSPWEVLRNDWRALMAEFLTR